MRSPEELQKLLEGLREQAMESGDISNLDAKYGYELSKKSTRPAWTRVFGTSQRTIAYAKPRHTGYDHPKSGVED